MVVPSVGLDLVHLMILKLVLHTIRETVRDEDPARSLWPLLSNYVSRASFYRKFSELELLGLVGRVGRGRYIINAGGCLLLLFAYFMGIDAIDRDTFVEALRTIKNYWGLQQFHDYEVESYVKLLYLKYGRSNDVLFIINQEFPKNVLLILPGRLKFKCGESLTDLLIRQFMDKDAVAKASRVVAKAIVEYFPTTKVDDCDAVIVIENGRRRVLARHCGGDDYELL